MEQNRRATMRLTDWKVFRRIGKSTFASARWETLDHKTTYLLFFRATTCEESIQQFHYMMPQLRDTDCDTGCACLTLTAYENLFLSIALKQMKCSIKNQGGWSASLWCAQTGAAAARCRTSSRSSSTPRDIRQGSSGIVECECGCLLPSSNPVRELLWFG